MEVNECGSECVLVQRCGQPHVILVRKYLREDVVLQGGVGPGPLPDFPVYHNQLDASGGRLVFFRAAYPSSSEGSMPSDSMALWLCRRF